jgi:hypothetical protein
MGLFKVDTMGIQGASTLVNSLNARLESDHIKKIDPVDTWNSIQQELDQHKASMASSTGLTSMESSLIGLVENLVQMCTDLYTKYKSIAEKSTGENLPPSDPATDHGVLLSESGPAHPVSV